MIMDIKSFVDYNSALYKNCHSKEWESKVGLKSQRGHACIQLINESGFIRSFGTKGSDSQCIEYWNG